MYRITQQQT